MPELTAVGVFLIALVVAMLVLRRAEKPTYPRNSRDVEIERLAAKYRAEWATAIERGIPCVTTRDCPSELQGDVCACLRLSGVPSSMRLDGVGWYIIIGVN